jgi:hypothetical protein
MFVNFNTLPESSRVWVYQADRAFTTSEHKEIEEKLTIFVQHWKRHGDALKASFLLKYNQFIVLAVDENYNDVSGCSIDASVHIIKQLQEELHIDLLNKMTITFKDGDSINTVSMAQFKEFAKLDKITPNTVVFNNMIASKAELSSAWEVEASKSWHAKFLN